MSKSDLNRPLAQRSASERPARRRGAIAAPILVSLALLIAIIAGIWVAVVDDPDGGRPVAVARIEAPLPPSTGSIPAGSAAIPSAVPGEPAVDSQGDAIELASLPHLPAAVSGDPSLIEASSFGPLPRVSPDGRRPRDAYARRAAPVPDGVPRIVLVVGGLGLSQTGTQRAIETLPPDITLAFAPYGSSLERWVSKARDEGHEVLLQIPLEPADYPAVDPGPHTLLVSAGGTNRDSLHWSLGRMTGYAGVMNHMGARFLQDEQVVLPFLGEIGDRGLFYLDDGSTQQDVAAKIGGAIKVPVVTADQTIDRVRTQSAIEDALAELEALARTRGLAVGVASAFPVSVDTIASWTREAEKRGIVIIPASAAANS